MSEIVFILGAGASKAAGAPLMPDFLDKADALHKAGKVDQFKSDFDRVFDAISALQRVHSKAELDLDNIESVFAAFEMGRLLNTLPSVPNDEIGSLLVSIRRLIFKTLEKTVIYPVRDGRIHPNEVYDSFAILVDALNQGGRQNRCSIITFNYDLALDHALFWRHHSVDYCLSETREPGYVSLMKLHGSLNWATCSKCGETIPWPIRGFFEKFQFPVLEDIEFVHLDLASQLSASGLKHCEQDVKPDPVLVPPTWNKTEYHQNLSKVWSRAAAELSDAENIFVSGYSLPETDLFFRYLYALGSVGRTRIKRFWVFDPDEHNVRPRFEDLIGPGVRDRFRFARESFSHAINAVTGEFSIKISRHSA